MKYVITVIQIKSDVLTANKKFHKANFCTLSNILKDIDINIAARG